MEIYKLLVAALTPLSVSIVGYYLNRRLKNIDDAQWQNRKLVEKRLELYDQIAPNLNAIYCFFVWVGYWKDVSPQDLIEKKRELDKVVNINKYLLCSNFYTAYNHFIHLVFRTYTGIGKDALIKSNISGSDGDRRKNTNYTWQVEFEQLFDTSTVPRKSEVVAAYEATMKEFQACIGISETK
ncbi:hypothetical protein [Phaeobacter gallaeciensis]|uniref:hypothetical protein n=1 Tax=Phaeobacter gallaeciensis TaxID=60890 RepID=UPI00237FC901|nr:hypothetical protein [Phaeobacter gallaeciensis]MDE4191177.1 hypothetical protein [Phaeobacter gallaeciensis]MDE4199642.1 hypothetical protein [Phaeobacter gallaeciensis]MDE4203790.1 hypothetical protein [Phaeobacter gallaeciensis]MDE4207932.1 hypothetical protein [Phaeobacter gallaeciensis]MDE4216299.1 hypothetical protein [Phaeobacter gallaeciensis]